MARALHTHRFGSDDVLKTRKLRRRFAADGGFSIKSLQGLGELRLQRAVLRFQRQGTLVDGAGRQR